MEDVAREPFYVGDWLVQPRQNRIRGPQGLTRVEPKVMEVLVCLARRPGEVLDRDTLLATVWAGTVVTDDVLTRSISELRKAFGDTPRAPRVIETIPKTGYRLMAPVGPAHHGDSSVPAGTTLEVAPAFTAAASPEALPRRRWWLLPGAVLLAGAAVVLVWRGLRPAASASAWAGYPVPLTSDPGTESRPAWSPDGSRVAYVWTGPAGDNGDVYVRAVGTETSLRLTTDPAYDTAPAWSPDGTRIAFIRWEEGQGPAVYVVGALGGPAQRLADAGATIYADLAWSPDGRWMAFNNRASDDVPYSLVLLSPERLDRRRLTTPPSGIWGDHDPRFSPDGTRLTFTRSVSEGMQDLYTVPVDGGEAERLTFDSRNVLGNAWSPDGRQVFYASNRTGRVSLWRLPAAGGTPVWVPISDAHVAFPDVAPVTGRLVYQHASGATNIWRIRAGAPVETAEPMVASTRWDLHPQPSPDGRRLAFTSNRSGTYEIWISEADGTGPAKLTAFDGPFTSTPRWSPDGRRLAFTARPGGTADVYVVDAAGGRPRAVTTDPSDDLAAAWSPDGRMLYFTSNRSGAWEVWRMPAAGGLAEPVTARGGFGPQLSPDGASVYYARPHAPGLWRMPLSGGAEVRVLPDLDPRDWGSWAVREDGITFVRRGGSTAVVFHAFATGTDTVLFTPPQDIPVMDPALAVSPEGAWIFFGQAERPESDLMLIEGFR